MAFDTKQLKTCKALWKIATAYDRYYTRSDRLKGIFVRFGRFYATNAFCLVYVEWPEYQHEGDDEWMTLSPHGFLDENNHLKKFELKPMENAFKTNDVFEVAFIQNYNETDSCPVDPRLLKLVLDVFEVNGLSPIIYCDGTRYELSAHDKDISVKALVMGKRR